MIITLFYSSYSYTSSWNLFHSLHKVFNGISTKKLKMIKCNIHMNMVWTTNTFCLIQITVYSHGYFLTLKTTD